MFEGILSRVISFGTLTSTQSSSQLARSFSASCVSLSSKSSSGSTDLTTYKKSVKPAGAEKDFSAYTPSPYRVPGPKRYGYAPKYKTDGLLPRDGKPVRSLPPYRPKNSWDSKHALFGQNDYIDILGDGTVHPADLLTGPKWLVAFKGNERERLMRRLEWEGPRLRLMYPTEYNRVQKRVRYLTKLYNHKRKGRWAD